MSESVNVVRRFLTAEFELDADGMCRELADEIVIEFPHAFEGMQRRYEGKDVVEPMIKQWICEFWSDLRLTKLDIRAEADPERVVAEYASSGTVASNGKPYVNNYAGVFTVKGGKIIYHAEYFDPLPVMRGMDLMD